MSCLRFDLTPTQLNLFSFDLLTPPRGWLFLVIKALFWIMSNESWIVKFLKSHVKMAMRACFLLIWKWHWSSFKRKVNSKSPKYILLSSLDDKLKYRGFCSRGIYSLGILFWGNLSWGIISWGIKLVLKLFVLQQLFMLNLGFWYSFWVS